MCLIISLAMPLNRARPCFIIVTAVFGLMSITTIVGIWFYLFSTGIMPHHMEQINYEWHTYSDTHFSYLVLAGYIMMGIYFVPILFRPIDFLENFSSYLIGLLTYLTLIPLFANVFSIYSMANLHDVSWGNRPATAATGGTEAFTADAKKQQQTKESYKAYRANFLFFWFCANGAYFVFCLSLSKAGD